MRILRRFWARVRGTVGGRDARDRADAELREEFESHLAMQIDENLRRGMGPDEARRQALLAAGGLTRAAEAVREQRALPFLESLLADLRYALRALRLNRGYAAAVILTAALGIGANAAMFTIVNAVVLRPLPYPDADRIVFISLMDGESDRGIVDDRTYLEWARSAASVSIATSSYDEGLITIDGATANVIGQYATAGYFKVLGVAPRLGRTFTAAEDVPNGPRVVVLSEQFWRTRLHSDPGVVGRTLTLDDKPATVIGVMPAAYTTEHGAQFWVPYRLSPPAPNRTYYYEVTGRLHDGVTMAAARAELATLRMHLQERRPANAGGRVDPPDHQVPRLVTLHQHRYGDTSKPLLLLLAAVGVLLLIACANLANLSLARAMRRERELVVRLALGANRWRLVQAALCESFVLSLAGAGVGLALSAAAVRYFVRLSPVSVGRVEGIHVDGHVLAFTLLVTVATAVAFGVLPARVARQRSLTGALANGSPRAAGTRRQRWVRGVLVIAQLATALVLITAAGIVARTFWRVTSLDVGFRPDHLVSARITLPGVRYDSIAGRRFYDDLIMRVRGAPGVERAGYTDARPLGGAAYSMSTKDAKGNQSPQVLVVDATPGYLETIGVRLVAGRLLTAEDRAGAPAAAVITRETARMFFPIVDSVAMTPSRVITQATTRAFVPGDRAVGRTLPLKGLTVVGVIDDVRQWGLEVDPKPAMYLAAAQQGAIGGRMSLFVRTAGPTEPIEALIQRTVHAMDPLLAPPTITTMEQKLADSAVPRRFTFVLLGVFALIAGALAVIGLYGLLAYLVAERTREIGIRVALGADARRVRRLVVGQGMTLVGAGVAIGLAGSFAAARTLQGLVYQMSVYDARAFAGGTALLLAVAYVACRRSARRASRVDPVIALRAD